MRCDCGASLPALHDNSWCYSRCRGCGTLFRISGEAVEYAERYSRDGGYVEFDSPAWKAWDMLQLQELCRLQPQLLLGGRLLDVGCGWGRLVLCAAERGIEAYGYETEGVDALLRAKPALRDRIFSGPLTAIDERFSVITAIEVVEHIEDSQGFFTDVFTLLRPSGWFVGTTGNAQSVVARIKGRRWAYLKDEHVKVYSAKGLSAALANAGFSSVRIKTGVFPAAGPFTWRLLSAEKIGIYDRGIRSLAGFVSRKVVSSTMTFMARRQA